MADPQHTADMSQLAEEVNNNDKPAMAEAVPNPEEHGVTGPQADDPGKAQGVVAGQEEREAQASQGAEEQTPPETKEEPAEEFEEFEITISEDSPLSEEQFNSLMDVVEKAGMSEEQAKAFIQGQEDLYKAGASEILSARAEEAKRNREALINDEIFEGDFEGALKKMQPVVAQFGDTDFNELLRSEIGNHPALGKFIFRIAKAMESDSFHGKGGTPNTSIENPLKTLYPEFFKKA